MVDLLATKPNNPSEEDMRQFMDEIRHFPRLTPEEERALARRCADGDEDAIRQMVNANMRLVVAIARRYYNGSVPMLDMIQEGSIGLLTAARKFDYTRDVRFSTYATKWIRQGVIRYSVLHGNLVRVPAHTAALIRKVTDAQSRLREQLEREPDLQQIAEECQMPADKVSQLLQLQPKTCSLDAPMGADGDAIPVEDLQAIQPHQQLVREELNRIIEQLLSMLNERQRRILRLRFGMEDGRNHSLEEIAQLLGVSKERVRQVEKQAMEKLKKLGAGFGLEDFLE